MKTFHCTCGQPVFFDNTTCRACGRRLGFDWSHLQLLGLEPVGEPGDEGRDTLWRAEDGREFRRCDNEIEFGNCNWLLPAEAAPGRCVSCARNQVIPALGRPGNLELWTRVEVAKRRLLYSLADNGLRLDFGPGQSLNFRIMEDQRRNPDVLEPFIPTAHQGGTITLNIAEADNVERQAAREQLQERYRTVLGHLRHESGHFYFNPLVVDGGYLPAFRDLFGDEQADYEDAMARHYDNGPDPEWPDRYISAYAAAHPGEDFAESFAHWLHIRDALDSARHAGLVPAAALAGEGWLDEWSRLAVALNEIGRSLGWDDPYPFVLNTVVRAKLAFIDRVARGGSAV